MDPRKSLVAAVLAVVLAPALAQEEGSAAAEPQTQAPVEESASAPETAVEPAPEEGPRAETAAEPAEPAPEPGTEMFAGESPADPAGEPPAEATAESPAPETEAAAPAATAEAAPEPVPTIPVEGVRAEEAPAPLPEEGTTLDTIEVTASYRKENIQDVAGSAHAFGGRALDKAGATGMEDYLVQVPSVSLQKSGNGTAKIGMRGISNVNESDLGYADGSPTTGVYLDDVAIQGSGVFPDLNIYDLARIEVLKGPQGTLYGEGSMGGAIKMITRDPSYNDWELRGNTSYGWTEMGDTSWDTRLAINVPLLDDTLAARIVGTRRVTGGFVDYVNMGREDADKESADSLRGLLRWQVTDKFQVDLMHLADNTNREQFPVVDEDKQEERTNSRVEDQYAITEFSINALTVRWELPFANLTSVSAVYDTFRDTRRRTPVLQNLVDGQYLLLGLGHAPDIFSNGSTRVITDLDSFSQELRLVSFGGETFDWILGGFYRDRTQGFEQEKREDTIPDFDPTGGLLTQILGGFNPVQGRQEAGFGEESFRQYAAYGELRWNAIRDTLDITAGLRWYSEDVGILFDTRFYGLEAFLLASEPSNIDPETNTAHIAFETQNSSEGYLPKLSAGWHFNEDHMAYATVSRGFRSGSANIYAALEAGPPIMRPDYVWNYELGTKSTWLDGRLTTNLSGYHLDWKDMQGTVLGSAMLGRIPVPNFAHLDNAGDAEVWGAEASMAWLLADRLTLLGNVGYTRGEVTKSGEGTGVKEGSKLPNMPEITWSASASYRFDLPFDLTGDASVTYAWVDEQNVIFEPDQANDLRGNPLLLPRYTVPSYSLLKANASAGSGQWRLQLYGDNLLDDQAIVAISGPIAQYTVITPRTVGVRLSYEF